ncbi:phosphonoacetaldehyde hydrolase, partial [Pseudomonas aeruginosa]
RAGMWTLPLTCSGHALVLTYDPYNALPAADLQREPTRIAPMFEGSRPHFLISPIADLPAVVPDINARLARGEMPQGN